MFVSFLEPDATGDGRAWNDKRTRRADGLHVEVYDGIALLRGVVSPDVFDVAPLLAEGVEGVRMVDNRLQEIKRGWRPWRGAPSSGPGPATGSGPSAINPAR